MSNIAYHFVVNTTLNTKHHHHHNEVLHHHASPRLLASALSGGIAQHNAYKRRAVRVFERYLRDIEKDARIH